MMKLNRVPIAPGKRAPGSVALVAHPATSLDSGIKNFMCNLDGVGYEKALGLGTASAVAKIKACDPDPTWVQTK